MDSKATVFEFTSYAFEPDKKRAVFSYKTEFSDDREPVIWTETILLPSVPDLKHTPRGLLDKLLQSLHIILGISYWKYYCAPKLAFGEPGSRSQSGLGTTNVSLPYVLSKQEANFWNIVYKKGLGEFFYKNNLDPVISPQFSFSKENSQTRADSTQTGADTRLLRKSALSLRKSATPTNILVGVGGGKDSIVSAELLKQAGANFTSFHIETSTRPGLVDNVIKTIGAPSLKIQRRLDPKVHQHHQYNGHIPISAIYAFLGIFACVLYKYDHFIVSNEHSSNFGSITYKGLEINHQWSKSFEFETLFSNYVKNFISPDVKYFSLLRPFYEIRIVKMFASMKKYFPHFSSCNRNFATKGATHKGLWCGQCAKCVFAFILLSAFLPKKELLQIFGKNLYQQENLLSLFKDILGFGSMKPFDCVGTFEEARTALFLARKKFSADSIVRQVVPRTSTWYYPEVLRISSESNISEQCKFLGMEKVYILGYGKEGKITKQYLKRQYPKIKIGVGDTTLDKNYLEKQVNFDIAIKTPGIKKALVKIPYTTATNIFFSKVLGRNLIIGVTGSKGKSTTSSLIYHILKVAGRNVELLGNIGKPMLGTLLKPVTVSKTRAPFKKGARPSTQRLSAMVFVLELSSYQLDDIKFSPDIAVVTNLFPEHMDFHGSLENYYNAKKNIINFQNKNQYFVYNEKTVSWLKDYRGKAVKFSPKKYPSNLIGEHNQSNIGAAVAVAEILKIPQEKVKKAIKSFKGLEHRLENVGTFKGITFYDDAISTTPESTIMAIKALSPRSGIPFAGKNVDPVRNTARAGAPEGPLGRAVSNGVDTIFLGGQDRGYNFTKLEKIIKQYNIKNVVLFPDSGAKMLKSVKGFNILRTKKMAEAVQFAYQNTKKGGICLLSCASPSYSLWKNFEVKGDEFKKFVKKFAN